MIGNIQIFTLLKTRMQWHQQRQTILAENIANANTANYQARDLAEPDFKAILARQSSGQASGGALKITNGMHIQAGTANNGFGASAEATSWEVTPSGNSVVLEDQMLKLAENQLDYQTITALYNKSIKLMKLAVGK